MVPDIIIRSRRVSREVCPLLTKPLLTDVDKKERCLQAQNQQSGEVAGTSSLPPKTSNIFEALMAISANTKICLITDSHVGRRKTKSKWLARWSFKAL